MIEMTTWVWFAAGFMAGCLHASLLWRATRRLTMWAPVWGILRMSCVAGVLVSSALSGFILASAAGWAIGGATLGTWLVGAVGDHLAASLDRHTR